MTRLPGLLSRMNTLGVELWLEGGVLKYRAPKGTLTQDDLSDLKNAKPELIAFLASLNGGAMPRLCRDGASELSNAQRRLWVLCQLEAGAEAYNIPLHQELRGRVDLKELKGAFERLVERHESLRTRFPLVDGEPRQLVEPEIALPWSTRDLRNDSQREQNAKDIGRRHARRAFDLEAGPLFDIEVLLLDDDRIALLFTVHHIVADGVSIGVMARDLSLFYNELSGGETHAPPALPVQYRDYAEWQRCWLKTHEAESHRDYWRGVLSPPIPVLAMPTDRARPPRQTFEGKEIDFVFDADLSAAIQSRATRANASLFAALLALTGALLHRHSGQSDVMIGSPFAGRDHSDLADQVGFYVNTVPLRIAVEPEMTWDRLLKSVRQSFLGAIDHPYPLDELIPELDLERDFSRSPLFDVCVILQNQSDEGLRLNGLEARSFFEHPGTSKFDLTFCFKMVEGRLALALEYNTRLFDRARMDRLIGQLKKLAESLVDDKAITIAEAPLLTDAERDLILHEWNRTEAELPVNETTLDAFRRSVERAPEAEAVRFGESVMSYADLERRSNQIARALLNHGVSSGAFVGVYANRRLDLPAVMLGVWKTGCAYIPLDPAFPNERIKFMIDDSGALALLGEESLKADVEEAACAWIPIESIDDSVSGEPVDVEPPSPDALAYAIYTSGSTGRPKGVCIPHRALLNFLLSMSRSPGFSADDRLLAVTTISFDISALELFLPLICGGQVAIESQEASADAFQLMERIERVQPTVMQATPATWRMLIEAGWQGCEGLVILCGGEALPGELAGQLLSRGRAVWNLYGPTETTIWSCIHRVGSVDVSDAAVSIGRPIANTRVYVVDERMKPSPVGVPGELLIAGEGLAVGYHNREALTSEKFIQNPFHGSERAYRTGDVARWRDDGSLEYLGRSDHQVKVRGFRIEIGEIEAALGDHPSVDQAVVIVANQNSVASLAAYLKLSGDASDSELRDGLRTRLPEYMVPSAFIRVDGFPLTPNGKVDRKALPALASPEPAERRITPPRDETETTLLGLWHDVLGTDSLGVTDHFFEHGGHSILATRLAYRIQRELNVAISLRDVFERPSVETMAAYVRQAASAPGERIEAIEAAEPKQNDESPSGGELTPEELELLNED